VTKGFVIVAFIHSISATEEKHFVDMSSFVLKHVGQVSSETLFGSIDELNFTDSRAIKRIIS